MIGALVGSQASVPHQDMASVIAAFSLWSFLGSSVGDAIASGIWTGKMLRSRRSMGRLIFFVLVMIGKIQSGRALLGRIRVPMGSFSSLRRFWLRYPCFSLCAYRTTTWASSKMQ